MIPLIALLSNPVLGGRQTYRARTPSPGTGNGEATMVGLALPHPVSGARDAVVTEAKPDTPTCALVGS